jgi:hypothetical protein
VIVYFLRVFLKRDGSVFTLNPLDHVPCETLWNGKGHAGGHGNYGRVTKVPVDDGQGI